MKWLLGLALTITMIPPCSSSAQTSAGVDAAAVPEAQYIKSFYAVGANGELKELEHQNTTFKAHTKAFPGYATVKMAAELKPAHASVRVPPNVQFVVPGRTPMDPASRFELRLLKVSKDHREIVMTVGHGTIVGASATSTFDETGIALKFEEYGSSSYRITPAKPLTPGEYAIGLKGVVTELYCFGVYQ